ncbi:MAG: 5-histidylcysteine sulfoxide synthase [Acidiferrobacter sp.]
MTLPRNDTTPHETGNGPRILPISLNGDSAEKTRAEIRDVFHQTFSLYERLYEHLALPAAWYERAISLRHPLIFYFGHTATFFVNKLQAAGVITRRLNPAMESIFAIGVDEMSWDDMDDQHYDWPALTDVRAYRTQVRELVDTLIRDLPLTLPITWDSPWWIILMGIEHENIHLETSSVLMRQLPLTHVRPLSDFTAWHESGNVPDNRLLPVPAGTVELGKNRHSDLYGWDNEYGRHQMALAEFSASRYLVSNREFLPFVEAGGYDEPRWWSDEGLRWCRFAGPTHPHFWVPDGATWRLRVLAEERPMPWNWPVEVNCLEAQAFCAWKSAQTERALRLPTEDEWRRLRDLSGIPDSNHWNHAPANIGLAYGASPCPVDRFRHGAFYDVIGNVWQWTASPIYPFAGFAVHPHYDDFTVPTFDQQHNLIKGGSFISLGNEMQKEARYAFRRHFFQHAGFRYVDSRNPLPEMPVYESDAAVSQYAEFHYGESYFGVENFPAAVARIALNAMGDRPLRRALDIGCAVGRTSLELARVCPDVTGLDFSARFIQVGVQLCHKGSFSYALTEEGELNGFRTIHLRDLGLDGVSHNVHFAQADACNLKPLYTGYDLVVAANLIDRLYQPRKFLEDIADRIHSGGLLVLTSPYTWLTEHTPRSEWLGGFKRDGETLTTLESLQNILGGHFRLQNGSPCDLPFVIRETARKFQHTVSQLTIWERL